MTKIKKGKTGLVKMGGLHAPAKEPPAERASITLCVPCHQPLQASSLLSRDMRSHAVSHIIRHERPLARGTFCHHQAYGESKIFFTGSCMF